MVDLIKAAEMYGELLTFKTPSGHEITIRTQNGDDDDILTNGKAIKEGMAFCNFVSAIVIDSDYTKSGKLNPTDVARLRLPDVYYILLRSRIFSLGNIVEFSYQWDSKSKPIDYEEDLNLFVWDFDKPFPEKGSDNYNEFLIKPISKDLTSDIKLDSGKEVVYEFATPLTENYMAVLPLDKQSKNEELRARNLKLKNTQGEYNKVENFRSFSSRDMMQIRKDVSEKDPELSLVSDIENPNTGEIIQYPVMGSMDFFFPRGI